MHKKVLVTGANGQLGSELRVLGETTPELTFTYIGRSDVDFRDTEAIRRYFEAKTFDAVINCAAYTDVDKAESELELADAINHRAVEVLAYIAKAKGMTLIHISTDYVFDGKNFKPYAENEPTNPQGVYGQTKLDGEEAMLSIDPPGSLIIRTSWVYSEFGNNFVKTMLRLGKERDELGVIFDQVGTPTYARDLAKAVLSIIQKPEPRISNTEVYHYSNEGVLSWYDFAKEIMRMAKLKCQIDPIEAKEYPAPVSRPHYSLLNKAKIKKKFDISIPYWKDSLDACLRRMGERK